MVFVGDSLTDGGAVSDWRNQFRERVTEYLAAHGPVLATKYGKGGVRVAYWSVRRMPAGQALAIVELGTNDLFKRSRRPRKLRSRGAPAAMATARKRTP